MGFRGWKMTVRESLNSFGQLLDLHIADAEGLRTVNPSEWDGVLTDAADAVKVLEFKFSEQDDLFAPKPMTVREAFSVAFGSVPDGATCHIANTGFGMRIRATYAKEECLFFVSRYKEWEFCEMSESYGPDISDRPAEAFLGFFGERYDKAVRGEL